MIYIEFKMSSIKNIFIKNKTEIKTYDDFWSWFIKYEKTFFKVVKKGNNVEKNFFDKLTLLLDQIKEGIFYLTGMYNDNTVELILTPDGVVKNIVFVEELIKSAPAISGWKFTALKPAIDFKGESIEMAGSKFNCDNIKFYANEFPEYPDEIDITIVHDDYSNENKSEITNGTLIFLDNYLGELEFVTTIDNITVIGYNETQKELIPIEKFKSYLNWRQKEFIEKYEGTRYDTENDEYISIETELKNGKTLIGIINSFILNWDKKASHPWIVKIELKYKGDDNNGMPDENIYELLNEIEDEALSKLKDHKGYLNIGRETGDNKREIYFACKEFRKPSKVLNEIQIKYSDRIDIDFDIYKDKYWQSFNKFKNAE